MIAATLRDRSRSISGTTRSICSSAATGAAPGRDDSPPMSSPSAPDSIAPTQYAKAASSDSSAPPSEKESGVRLTIARMRARSSLSSRP